MPAIEERRYWGLSFDLDGFSIRLEFYLDYPSKLGPEEPAIPRPLPANIGPFPAIDVLTFSLGVYNI